MTIAEYVGISAKYSDNLLKSFEKDGLIEQHEKDLMIVNHKELVEITKKG